MKKVIIILIIFFYSTLIFAQEFKFGLERGYNLSSFRYNNNNFDTLKNIKPVITGNTNGFLSYKTKSFVGYTLELGIIQKGTKNNSKVKLYFVQMPATFDFYFSKNISFSAGSEFSYMFFGYKRKRIIEFQNISNVYKNNIEISGLAGINFKFDEILNIAFRYSRAFTSLSKISIYDNLGNKIGEAEEYNHYIQVLFRVNLSKVLFSKESKLKSN
jgi:hypothetical protein